MDDTDLDLLAKLNVLSGQIPIMALKTTEVERMTKQLSLVIADARTFSQEISR